MVKFLTWLVAIPLAVITFILIYAGILFIPATLTSVILYLIWNHIVTAAFFVGSISLLQAFSVMVLLSFFRMFFQDTSIKDFGEQYLNKIKK